MCSRRELAELERTPSASALLAGWTRKEAVLKACGDGLRREPASVEVGISACAAPRVVTLPDATAWSVVSPEVAPRLRRRRGRGRRGPAVEVARMDLVGAVP